MWVGHNEGITWGEVDQIPQINQRLALKLGHATIGPFLRKLPKPLQMLSSTPLRSFILVTSINLLVMNCCGYNQSSMLAEFHGSRWHQKMSWANLECFIIQRLEQVLTARDQNLGRMRQVHGLFNRKFVQAVYLTWLGGILPIRIVITFCSF